MSTKSLGHTGRFDSDDLAAFDKREQPAQVGLFGAAVNQHGTVNSAAHISVTAGTSSGRSTIYVRQVRS